MGPKPSKSSQRSCLHNKSSGYGWADCGVKYGEIIWNVDYWTSLWENWGITRITPNNHESNWGHLPTLVFYIRHLPKASTSAQMLFEVRRKALDIEVGKGFVLARGLPLLLLWEVFGFMGQNLEVYSHPIISCWSIEYPFRKQHPVSLLLLAHRFHDGHDPRENTWIHSPKSGVCLWMWHPQGAHIAKSLKTAATSKHSC